MDEVSRKNFEANASFVNSIIVGTYSASGIRKIVFLDVYGPAPEDAVIRAAILLTDEDAKTFGRELLGLAPEKVHTREEVAEAVRRAGLADPRPPEQSAEAFAPLREVEQTMGVSHPAGVEAERAATKWNLEHPISTVVDYQPDDAITPVRTITTGAAFVLHGEARILIKRRAMAVPLASIVAVDDANEGEIVFGIGSGETMGMGVHSKDEV